MAVTQRRPGLMVYVIGIGGISLLCSLIFLLRVMVAGDVVHKYLRGFAKVEIAPGIGWILALLAAGALFGLSIADYRRNRPEVGR
jgi:hypothetical protein